MKGTNVTKPQEAPPPVPVITEPDQHDRHKSNHKLSDRAKKKSWYNVIYPSYKSRSQTFKKLFKEVPNEERLIVGKLANRFCQ